MARREHQFHRVADEVADWVDAMSTTLAEGAHDGDRPPFGADVGDRERLDYYEHVLFNPDGSPNEQGRQQEIQRIGPRGYADVLMALQRRRGQPFQSSPSAPVRSPQEVSGYG